MKILPKILLPMLALLFVASCTWKYKYVDPSILTYAGQDYVVTKKYATQKKKPEDEDWEFANYSIKIDGIQRDCGITAESCLDTLKRYLRLKREERDDRGSDDSGSGSGGSGGSGSGGSGGSGSGGGSGGGDTDLPT